KPVVECGIEAEGGGADCGEDEAGYGGAQFYLPVGGPPADGNAGGKPASVSRGIECAGGDRGSGRGVGAGAERRGEEGFEGGGAGAAHGEEGGGAFCRR